MNELKAKLACLLIGHDIVKTREPIVFYESDTDTVAINICRRCLTAVAEVAAK